MLCTCSRMLDDDLHTALRCVNKVITAKSHYSLQFLNFTLYTVHIGHWTEACQHGQHREDSLHVGRYTLYMLHTAHRRANMGITEKSHHT